MEKGGAIARTDNAEPIGTVRPIVNHRGLVRTCPVVRENVIDGGHPACYERIERSARRMQRTDRDEESIRPVGNERKEVVLCQDRSGRGNEGVQGIDRPFVIANPRETANGVCRETHRPERTDNDEQYNRCSQESRWEPCPNRNRPRSRKDRPGVRTKPINGSRRPRNADHRAVKDEREHKRGILVSETVEWRIVT